MLKLSPDTRGLLKAIFAYVSELMISTILTYFLAAFAFVASIPDDSGHNLLGGYGLAYKVVLLAVFGAYLFVQVVIFKALLKNVKVNFFVLFSVALVTPAYLFIFLANVF